MSDTTRVTIHVNGSDHDLDVPNSEVLLDSLRDKLELNSVRGACGIGICGTCTVLVDGRPISSCLSLTALSDGRSIVTSEGLGSQHSLDPVQEAFVRNNAFQCSYCIPAMVLTVRAYLDGAESPSVEEAMETLAGNLCRCGTYPQVIEALGELIEGDEGPSTSTR
jgi:aerobic-type carbon monoxide dehydrogenase small subunit (CoxS/CutS family)